MSTFQNETNNQFNIFSKKCLPLTIDCEPNINLITDLQSYCRGYLVRRNFENSINEAINTIQNENKKLTNIQLLKYGCIIFYKKNLKNNLELIMALCQRITTSMYSTSKTESFATLFLSMEYIKHSTSLINKLCILIIPIMMNANLRRITSVKFVNCITNFLYIMSLPTKWTLISSNTNIIPILNTLSIKMLTIHFSTEENLIIISKIIYEGLKETKSILSFEIIDKLFFVMLRIIKNHQISNKSTELDDNLMYKIHIFCCYYLICPALIYALSNNTLNELKQEISFHNIVKYLFKKQTVVQNLSITDNLNLLANFIHLSYLQHEDLVINLFEWTNVMNYLLTLCQKHLVNPIVEKQKRNVNNWHHPLLGWTSERIEEGIQGTFGRVKIQLSYLWNQKIVECLFSKVLNSSLRKNSKNNNFNILQLASNSFLNNNGSISVESIQKILNKFSLKNQNSNTILNKPLFNVSTTAIVCLLYQNALITFSNAQIDILSGLCRDDSILLKLWNYVNNDEELGNNKGVQNYISYLNIDPTVSLPHFSPLHLFSDTAYSLISILDEKEMYESDKPFTLAQLREIAQFCNLFCFNVIWEEVIDLNQRRPNALFQSIYQLCLILYNRDCRRSFTTPIKNFWIIPEAKKTQIISEFERHQSCAQLLMAKMPHVVPLQNRMILFKKLAMKNKEKLNNANSSSFSSGPTTVITIERTKIVEDGYRQLANLSSDALRGTIRVKFINQQGLDEAGIDQDGVFKEFLELTIKKVFDPNLNLFKITSNGLLYPSSTSFVHENHLAFFQFIGKMLAKAVYEGICVDVQLAPVLLATVLGKQLCSFDELASLDPVLYKNLTYVKHYNDSSDVRDLALTFSYNEEFLGKIKTYELIPNGQDIEVNNENKIMYIHKMAQFRVLKQTKEQCDNFVAGFRSIINFKWLALFNIHELQYLISGQTNDINLDDLKKHTQYYGGFHSNHRVIKWLWSILQNDFTLEERQLFLKFVTSCSRAPLLGFEFLEPQFSIRCVETSDDMDQGDTFGSIVRGFLAIKRKHPITRLPTASTCFNLLKLPNYNKKSILLEKLRYAINAETGFELS